MRHFFLIAFLPFFLVSCASRGVDHVDVGAKNDFDGFWERTSDTCNGKSYDKADFHEYLVLIITGNRLWQITNQRKKAEPHGRVCSYFEEVSFKNEGNHFYSLTLREQKLLEASHTKCTVIAAPSNTREWRILSYNDNELRIQSMNTGCNGERFATFRRLDP